MYSVDEGVARMGAASGVLDCGKEWVVVDSVGVFADKGALLKWFATDGSDVWFDDVTKVVARETVVEEANV